MSSSGPGRCFLIFSDCTDKWHIVSLDKGTVFLVMGIRREAYVTETQSETESIDNGRFLMDAEKGMLIISDV